MKKLALALFLLSSVMAFADWPEYKRIPNPPGANHGWDAASGTWRPLAVTGDGKMVIDSAISIGSITVDPSTPPTANLTSVVAVTPTAANVASLANRKSLAIFNHSLTATLWASLDSATASATVNASIPIPPLGFISTELDAAKIIGLVASEAINATVYQDGY